MDDAFDDVQIDCGSEIGNRHLFAADAGDERRRQRDGIRGRGMSVIRNTVKHRRILNTKTALHLARGRSGRGGAQHETDAAMDREDRLPVVEARKGIDVVMLEQPPSKGRRAVVRGDPRRQHQADTAAFPDETHRALDE